MLVICQIQYLREVPPEVCQGGWIFVTLDCQKMHLLAPEQLKISAKNLGGMDMEQKI